MPQVSRREEKILNQHWTGDRGQDLLIVQEGKSRQEKVPRKHLVHYRKGTWVGLTELHGEKVWDAMSCGWGGIHILIAPTLLIDLWGWYFFLGKEGNQRWGSSWHWEHNEAAVTEPHSSQGLNLVSRPMVQRPLDTRISKDWTFPLSLAEYTYHLPMVFQVFIK